MSSKIFNYCKFKLIILAIYLLIRVPLRRIPSDLPPLKKYSKALEGLQNKYLSNYFKTTPVGLGGSPEPLTNYLDVSAGVR